MSSFYNNSVPGDNRSATAGGGAAFQQQGPYANYGHAPQQSQHQQQQQQQQQQTFYQKPVTTPAVSAAQEQYNQQIPAAAVPTPAAPAVPNVWNPAIATAVMTAAAGGVSGDSASVVLDQVSSLGSAYVVRGAAKLIPGLEAFMSNSRIYFAVDNRYVKRKIQTVLFPFTKKKWTRMEIDRDATGSIRYALPNSDDNAPDLYLPSMSIITYVLLCGLLYGTSGQFDPEILPDVLSKCSLFQLLEVLLIRFGFYAMQSPISIMDLIAYTGYKYMGLCCNMLIGLAFGWRGYYVALLWTASAMSYFVLKTLSNLVPVHNEAAAAKGPKREFMLLGFAGSQLITMYFVSQTKFLQ
mmetsp:Transcript_63295/g.76083  ORF Transcript_63295/g.76083 Transcript_63295/m.76083 type:complete len:352 (+) Transcript_63295:188-1243(+)